jgi:hypothetical protein
MIALIEDSRVLASLVVLTGLACDPAQDPYSIMTRL